VVGYNIKQAVRQGARLVVADPRRIELAERADVWLRHRPGTDLALINGLCHLIIREGLHDTEYIENRTEGYDEFVAALEPFTPEYVALTAGVDAGDLRRAARILGENSPMAIVYAMGITQHVHGTQNVLALANLGMLTGNVGILGGGVNPLRGQNNVQGACDVGGLPDVFPGYQKVFDDDARAKFEEAWGTKLSREVGLTVGEIMDAAVAGNVRAIYIMGENPMLSDPDQRHTREALEQVDFLVVQDIFMTETAELADVVLPAASFAEKDGTFTNTERRIQRVRKAVNPPGEARPDWSIIVELASRMGHEWNYRSVSDVMDELARLTPIYAGVAYDRLEDGGLQWPVPSREHPGTPYLHRGRFSRGLGLFSAIDYVPPAEEPDEEYPLVLTTGRILFHYHTGTMTRRVDGLNNLRPDSYVEISPLTARELGIADGDFVRVTSRRGSVVTRAWVTDVADEGVVFMPFHFYEAPANALTNPARDPRAKIPELKVAAVRIEKVEERVANE